MYPQYHYCQICGEPIDPDRPTEFAVHMHKHDEAWRIQMLKECERIKKEAADGQD